MNTMYKRLSLIVTGIMILALVITGCTSQASNIGLARENDQNTIGTDFVVAQAGSYDSADTAVVVSVDSDTGYVTFMNIGTGRQYTLSYDGTTYVKDRYEGPMAMSQIKAGDIVDITFLRSKKRLASVQLSPQSWVFDNIENYDLGGINKTATIGSNTYSLPDEAIILSEGKRADVMEIVNKDVLTISGIDHTIYSISVQRGHGYLRLSNEQALVGGWIEVGNAVVQRVTDDMLLAVPEGSYQVLLSNDNASCVKEVVIERNKEVILDVGDLEILQDKMGKILFSVNPSTATVKVDGETVDISSEVELTYGIHKIHLEAEGYQTMTKYIQVGSEYASLNFVMEEGEAADNEDSSSVSDNSSIDDIANAVTGNRVYIDAPRDVEVYLDGNYVGISPISFTKVTGDHTITLSKSGYQSKSYTIYLYNDDQDITYSFADLEPYNDTVSGNRSTSGRSTSTHTTTNNDTVSGNTINTKNIVSITAPEGVTIYLDDDIYVGISPASFTKEAIGRHKITLSKTGYQPVSYTIYLYEDGRDIVYAFEPLEPVEDKDPDDEEGNNSGTGNNNKDETGDKVENNGGNGTSSEPGNNDGDETGDESENNGGNETGDGDENSSGDETESGNHGEGEPGNEAENNSEDKTDSKTETDDKDVIGDGIETDGGDNSSKNKNNDKNMN